MVFQERLECHDAIQKPEEKRFRELENEALQT